MAERVAGAAGVAFQRAWRGVPACVALVFRSASRYLSALHASPATRSRNPTMTRIALAVWAAAIYAIYWLRYAGIGS